jgi:putative FmdB family regulatory protein
MAMMPTYEYRCTSCGNRFDVLQRIDESPLLTCERCGGELRKVFHPAGIVFKGSGFYATDSRKPAATSSKDGGGAEAKGSEKKKGKDEAGTSTPPTADKKPAGEAAS